MCSQWLKIGLSSAIVAAAHGCAARPAHVIAPEDVNASLIAPGGELQELAIRRSDHPSWEDSRNCGPALDRDLPFLAPWLILEVRHREHLSTINARPREFTSTTTRSIRREIRH